MTGIIFDLDGVLWDSTESISLAWNQVFALNDIQMKITANEIKQLLGKTGNEISKKTFHIFSEVDRKHIMKKCEAEELLILNKIGGVLYLQVEETLKKLTSKYKLFIVSNCQAGYIKSFLNYHNLSKYFLDVECEGNSRLPKADNILNIIERNNIKNAIYVGDTIGDYESSRKANIPFVYANYGFGIIKDSTYQISKIEELPQVIEKILKEIET